MNDRPAVGAETAEDSTKVDFAIVSNGASFGHYVADQVIPLFLGRDVEIACISFSPAIVSAERLAADVDGPVRLNFRADPRSTEIARVRMSPEAALGLGLGILEQLNSASLLDVDLLKENLEAMLASPSKSKDRQSDG